MHNYLLEILNLNKQLKKVFVIINDIFLIVISCLFTEIIIHYWRPLGMYIFYFIFTFFGFIFMFIFLKETDGLTDKQKKELYMPQEFKETPIVSLNDDPIDNSILLDNDLSN